MVSGQECVVLIDFKRWGLKIYSIVALLLGAVLLVQGYMLYQSVMATSPYDAVLDWNGARIILAGLSPYSIEGLKMVGATPAVGMGHPPTTLVWFLPLGRLSMMAMKSVWDELTLFFLFIHCAVMVFELELPSRLATLGLLLGTVLCSAWMRDHLMLGQLSELIALLYVLAWYHLRHRRDVLAGILLGLACTLKFYPGAVVLFFLFSRRWRVVFPAVATWFAVAIPITVRLGIQCWSLFAEQSKPYTTYWMSHVKNASIQGICQRLRYPICEFVPAIRDVWAPGAWLALLLSIAIVAGVWWVTRPFMKRDQAIDLPFALFTLVSLFTGPYAWEHYNVTLILPLLVAAVALVAARRAGLCWAWTLAGFALLGSLCAVLAEDTQTKNTLWDAWITKGRSSHFVLHFYEVSNWISSPALIGLLCALLVWAHRRAPAAFDRLRLVEDSAKEELAGLG